MNLTYEGPAMWDKTKHLTVTCPGDYHLRQWPPIPNQDAALTETTPRPFAILSDGAGSAKLSHIASSETVHGLASLIVALEPFSADLLDSAASPDVDLVRKYRFAFWAFLKERMRRLSIALGHDGNMNHFKTTLAIFIVGQRRSFFIKRGDSPIVIFRRGFANKLGNDEAGAWAGQVSFFSSTTSPDDLQSGLIATDFSDVMLCSDGFADLTVHRLRDEINPIISDVIAGLRSGKAVTATLFGQLARPEIASTYYDDKTVALLCLPDESKISAVDGIPKEGNDYGLPIRASENGPHANESLSADGPEFPPVTKANVLDQKKSRKSGRGPQSRKWFK